MSTFEDAGRLIDMEMKKLHEFFEREVKPATQQGAVDALRAASAKLARLADQLERRRAGKGTS
jgi:hypothetical protein